MGQFQTIINCFNKMENATLFTSLDLGARLEGKGIIITNVHNFVYIAFQMGVVCRDKIEKPQKRGGVKFIYMKERSLTNDEIINITTVPQFYDFMKQIKADFKKRHATTPQPVKKRQATPQPDRINNKPRPILKRMADLLNTYLPNSKFTIDEFIKSFADANRGEIAARGTAAVFLGRAVKHGYIISELIPKSGRSGPNVNYVKILNIAEKEMTNVTIHIIDKSVDLRKKRKEEPIVTQFIDDKIKVTVPLKLVKDMENLIKKQHKRVSELRQKLAEMFDENSTLVTQNRILNKRANHQADFDIDLSKYQDNLHQ